MKRLLLDLATLIAAAFRGERFHEQASRLFAMADEGAAKLHVLDIIALEAELLHLAGRVGVERKEWLRFIEDTLENPRLEAIPLDAKVFNEHERLYRGVR